MTTVTAPWWIWRSVQVRLIKWTLLLLGGRKYAVDLMSRVETGAHYPIERRIEVNPEMFPRESVEVQFRATQGLLLHEVGHARYTGSWPEQRDNVLCELVNMLEDERIERAMCVAFPGGAAALRLLGDLVYRGIRQSEPRPEYKAFGACLVWRWAHTRSDEREMFKRLGMSRDKIARELWSEIKPLVESAWHASSTGEVIELARKILHILNIDPGLPARRFSWVNRGGVPDRRVKSDPAMPLPSGPEIDGPGLDRTPRETGDPYSTGGRSWTRPQSYVTLEDAAQPLVRRIVETLQEARPDVRPRTDATTGRYQYRLESRDWEKPFQRRAEIGRAPRSLALDILIDWSSSMSHSANSVRLALMALHLAAEQLGIPHGITFFGAGKDAVPQERIETIVDFGRRGEWPKALIAGYAPSAGNEYLFMALDRAISDLQARSERDRIILCVHDGHPVWSGPEGCDWDLSIARVKLAEQKGIKVIGLYLGDDEEETRKMQRLFPHLITSTADQLPDKLGRTLISLA